MREQVVEDSHAHHQARPDLLADQCVGRVGDPRVDLDAAVHRPWMHHLLSRPQAFRRDAPARRVLAQAGHEVGALLHPLALHAEDVDDVGCGDRADVGRGLAAERLDTAREERRRPDERDPRVEQDERLHERACDAGVENVPDDRDVEALDLAESCCRV